jgi:hypothetical protein
VALKSERLVDFSRLFDPPLEPISLLQGCLNAIAICLALQLLQGYRFTDFGMLALVRPCQGILEQLPLLRDLIQIRILHNFFAYTNLKLLIDLKINFLLNQLDLQLLFDADQINKKVLSRIDVNLFHRILS